MTRRVARRCLVSAGALLLALVAAAGAWAQGMFYAEETKDGRIYVFNIKDNYDRWKVSGETGVGLTRLGVGPNGETVFADNETALDLFFFKHGIKEKVDRPAPPTQRVEWRDGKTRITLGNNFYMELSNRIQPRYTHELPDSSIQLPGTEARGDSKGSFRIRRAKLKFEGWFYKPTLEYEFQANWTDVNNVPASQIVEDASIDWDISQQKVFRVKFGQFKAPFGRQQLTSSGAQQFVDRAIQDSRLNDARETGISLWGVIGTNKLDWRFMASNGNSRSQVLNDNAKFLYTGRLMWQAVGNTRMNQWGSGALMTEGDLGDSAAGPLLALAGNVSNNNRHFATTGNDLNNTTWAVDYTFKYKGFAAVGEYGDRKSEPETGRTFHDKGLLLQASYAFKAPGIPGASFWELAFRYAKVDPSSILDHNDRDEIGGALNYYYNRHNLKVQADYRQLQDDAADSGRGTRSKEFRLQAQFVF